MTAFTNVAWANGNTITEQKLDEMVENDKWVREHAERTIMLSGAMLIGEGRLEPAGSTSLTFKIGALTIVMSGPSGGAYAQATGGKNWDISSLTAPQIHYLEIKTGSTIWVRVPVYVAKDTNYLSFWYYSKGVGADGTGNYFHSLVGIATRTDLGFTP